MEKTYCGKAGAGILFFCGAKVLLLQRSMLVSQPLTWGIPGGSVEGEYEVDPNGPRTTFPSVDQFWVGAKREVIEELGALPESFTVFDMVEFIDNQFKFVNFLATVTEEVRAMWRIETNWESRGYHWYPVEELPNRLHFGVSYVISQKPEFFALE